MIHNVRLEIIQHLTGITTMQPHPRNARQSNPEHIADSLQEHGQYKPVIVQDSTGHIVTGNHTWKAARSLGWNQIAAIRLDLSDDQAMRILLVDNRLSDLATYDDHSLAELLREIEKTGTFDGTGYGAEDLSDLLDKLADAATQDEPEPDNPPARTGLIECPECHHIWRADNHGDPV
jgi:hypothetical protein